MTVCGLVMLNMNRRQVMIHNLDLSSKFKNVVLKEMHVACDPSCILTRETLWLFAPIRSSIIPRPTGVDL